MYGPGLDSNVGKMLCPPPDGQYNSARQHPQVGARCMFTHPMQPPRIQLGLAVGPLARHRRCPAATVDVLGILPLGLNMILEEIERRSRLQLPRRPYVVVQAARSRKKNASNDPPNTKPNSVNS